MLPPPNSTNDACGTCHETFAVMRWRTKRNLAVHNAHVSAMLGLVSESKAEVPLNKEIRSTVHTWKHRLA